MCLNQVCKTRYRDIKPDQFSRVWQSSRPVSPDGSLSLIALQRFSFKVGKESMQSFYVTINMLQSLQTEHYYWKSFWAGWSGGWWFDPWLFKSIIVRQTQLRVGKHKFACLFYSRIQNRVKSTTHPTLLQHHFHKRKISNIFCLSCFSGEDAGTRGTSA